MLLDQSEKHALQIQRLATKLFNDDLAPTIESAYKAARAILREYDELSGIGQRNAILKAIEAAITEQYTQAWQSVTDELEAFAVYEAGYYAALMSKVTEFAFSVPAKDKIQAYINKSLMSLESGQKVTAGTWAEFIKQNTDEAVTTYQNIVKSAYANNQTVQQATKRMQFASEGLLKHHAEGLVRNGLQHYSTQARLAFRDDNLNVITREVPSTVWDNRRSLTCTAIQSKYGQKGWPVKQSPVGYPPYHYGGCRTQILFLVKDQDELEGTRTATLGESGQAAKEAYEEKAGRTDGKVVYKGRKDLNIFDVEQIKANSNVDAIMRAQPLWYIESALGKTRARLFLDGKLKLSSFADASGRPLSIKELRALDARAFEDAGL